MTFLYFLRFQALGKTQAIIPSVIVKKKENNLSSAKLKNASQGDPLIIFLVITVHIVSSENLNKVLMQKLL